MARNENLPPAKNVGIIRTVGGSGPFFNSEGYNNLAARKLKKKVLKGSLTASPGSKG